jgi:ATP-dependent Zn protease
VSLGGRIAEHFILGAENMTVNTASSDLESATNMCRTMFGFSGISLDIRNPETVSDNLAVIVDRSTTSEDAYVENLTRQYLKKQYDHVFHLFSLNKDLLSQIINRLKAKRVLDQKELLAIYEDYLARSIKKAA